MDATYSGHSLILLRETEIAGQQKQCCGATMQPSQNELAYKLSRSLKTFECTLPHRCSIEALEQSLAIAELLRGAGDAELERFATNSMERCARFVLACAKEELSDKTDRAEANRWWNLGYRLARAGYALPAGFGDILLERTQKIFLRRTIELLGGTEAKAAPAPSFRRDALLRQLAEAVVAGEQPRQPAVAST